MEVRNVRSIDDDDDMGVCLCVCNVSMFAVEEFRRHKQHTKSESLPYLEV